MKIEMERSFSTLSVGRLSQLMDECKDFAEFLIAVRREEEAQVTAEEIRPYLEGEQVLSKEDEAALRRVGAARKWMREAQKKSVIARKLNAQKPRKPATRAPNKSSTR